jgi:hypothetical protein
LLQFVAVVAVKNTEREFSFLLFLHLILKCEFKTIIIKTQSNEKETPYPYVAGLRRTGSFVHSKRPKWQAATSHPRGI